MSDRTPPSMVVVPGRRCPHDPKTLLGEPLGQYHCPDCGCMVIAGIDHGPCFGTLCPLLDANGNDLDPEHPHPGERRDFHMIQEHARMLGLV